MLVAFLLLALGLVVLTVGADKFVEGASSLAKKFNVSELVIGLTVVAFGTSAPELVVNAFAAIEGSNGIAYGNIIGSNSFNLLLILGIAGMISPLQAHPSIVKKDAPYSFFAAILLLILVNDYFLWGITPTPNGQALESMTAYPTSQPVLDSDGKQVNTIFFVGLMTRLDAIILLVFFAYFLYYVFKSSSSEPKDAEDEGIKELSPLLTGLYIIGGLGGLILGGKLIVDNAVFLAKLWGMSDGLVGLTIVSAGTSLPELATSCIAAYRKKSDIAIANVIGSNIFNIFFILGTSAAIMPIPFDAKMNMDLYVLIGTTVLFFGFLFMSKPVHMEASTTQAPLMGRVFQRWQGFVFFALYVAYTAYLIWREGVQAVSPI